MFGLFDPLYWALLGPCLLLSIWATIRVKSTFNHYKTIGTGSGLSGADVARKILADNGISDVRVEAVQGFLSDHYDPTQKVLRLSPEVFEGRSLSSLGVAAHEVGHAVQHATGYAPLGFRSAIVPLASIAWPALTIRLRNTWCSRDGRHSTSGKLP